MAFLTLVLCGLAGGVLGGMGMGGGTVLIPLLTLFGVDQAAAQGINLVSFLPMAALALPVHAKSGLLRWEGLVPLVLSALAFSALGSLLAARLPSALLERRIPQKTHAGMNFLRNCDICKRFFCKFLP